MKPVFVALTEAGLATAQRARSVIGGEVHVLAPAISRPFSQREKVAAPGSGQRPARGQAVQPDEGLQKAEESRKRRNPSPVAFGDTLSLWEREDASPPPPDLVFTDTAVHLRALFSKGRPIVGICAAGILIRILAPLLADKREEPPVVAVSEDGASIVPLLGGHRGANALARALAAALGGHAAITTAGDNRFGVALDAPPEGWTLTNPEHAKPVMAALLAGAAARLDGDAQWLAESRLPFASEGAVRLIATTRAMNRAGNTATITSPLRGGRKPAERSEAGFREGVDDTNAAPPSRSSPAASRQANFDLPSRGRLERETDAGVGAAPLLEPTADTATEPAAHILVYHPRRLAVGIGCERGTEPGEALDLLHRTLDEAGLAAASVALVASIDVKADEPAVLEAAKSLGVPARFFSAAALEAETPRLANPSKTVFREVGCHGVAEGAALAAAGAEGRLVVAKRKSARVTCAVAEAPDPINATRVGRGRGKLAIVGIGPGSSDWLTLEAKRLLQASDAAVGYSLYLDLVAPLIARAERFESTLGSEEARVRQALSLAAEGRSVALISSGDAGIYAMATLVFECLDQRPGRSVADTLSKRAELVPPPSLTGEGDHAKHGGGGTYRYSARHSPPPPPSAVPLPRFAGEERPDGASRIEIVVAPGVSAMQAAAARAGAPLGHDFCAISLSDLLTPWAAIEARINAAAEGDFVIAFYNPVSGRRRTQLAEAKKILLQHRPPDTPVVLARNLGRAGESVTTIPLVGLQVDMVDMLTLVLVGASSTRQVEAAGRIFTYTPRGYERKRCGEARQPSPLAGEGAPSLREGAGEGSSIVERSEDGPSPSPSPQGGGE